VILLALDSAEATASVALWDSGREEPGALLAYRRLASSSGQADRLVELIDSALGEAALFDYQALGMITVNHGPGGFTGLRSAVAAARGLALAAGLPVLAVGSLEALAAAVPARNSGTLLAALDARRGQVYAQAFDHRGRPRGSPRAVTPEEASLGLGSGPLRLVGSGAPLVRAALPEARPVVIETAEPDARWVARCAVRRLAEGERPQSGFTLRPFYLRPPDARLPTPVIAPARAAGC
jgi:tRNA threonylcarbamoyladenosine biosynthesis protein TsaB